MTDERMLAGYTIQSNKIKCMFILEKQIQHRNN